MQGGLHARVVNDDTTNGRRAQENHQDIDRLVGANTREREQDHQEGHRERARQDHLDGPVARCATQPEITRPGIEDQSDERGHPDSPFTVQVTNMMASRGEIVAVVKPSVRPRHACGATRQSSGEPHPHLYSNDVRTT